MKLSARNTLKGKIVRIATGSVNSEVTIELTEGIQVIAVITNISVANLKLTHGADAYAVIKASDVMIAVDE